jgi:hypothetical protein
MSARKDDEPRQTAENIKELQHAVGPARFITDTVGYQIASAASALAKHIADPSVRHWMALKKILRFLAGKRDMNFRYYRACDPQDAKRQLQAWVDSDWGTMLRHATITDRHRDYSSGRCCLLPKLYAKVNRHILS